MSVDGEGHEKHEEPELIADEQQCSQPGATAPPAWWGGAWQAIEHKIDYQSGVLADRMTSMFEHANQRFEHIEKTMSKQAESTQGALADLDEKINMESKIKELENAENMKRIEERLLKLEKDPGPSTRTSPPPPPPRENAPTTDNENTNWQADHVIIGGWRPEAPAAEKIQAARLLLAALPGHLRGRHLDPYQPGRERCGVFKVRFESPAAAAQSRGGQTMVEQHRAPP